MSDDYLLGTGFAVYLAMNRSLSLLPILLVAAATFAACTSDAPDTAQCDDDKCDTSESKLSLCTAIRGNGELITAHFSSLARIVEHYGVVDATAGGSSASITSFMIESIQLNPATTECAGNACTTAEVNARTALLFKSFPGYFQHLGTTEEAATIGNALPFIQKIQEAGVEALLDEDAEAGVAALRAVLESEELQDLVNPELILLLSNSPDPEMHARDILAGIQGLGSFSAAVTDKVFIRPSLFSFPAIADKLGRVADFYAGYGPSDSEAMESFMAACASPGLGLDWFQVSALEAGERTCGGLFDEMLGNYRAALATNSDTFSHRIDESVGGKLPALISTSVLSGATAESFVKARADYNNAEDYTFEPLFSDVTFGYWGQDADLKKVEENINGYDDLKTAKFTKLGETSWRTALSYSPAEPGLSRALELEDGRISAGGWSDLHPVLALRNLGCENVVYITRTGDESSFAQAIAGLLGMTSEQQGQLYDLDQDSAFALSLGQTDATWCTNWDDFRGTDILAIAQDGYNAPMTSTDDFFTKARGAYGNISTTPLRGCSIGAPKAE